VTVRLAVLASGAGTNLQAILDAQSEGVLSSTTVAVMSDRIDAGALVRARESGVKAIAVPKNSGEDRRAYDQRLADTLEPLSPDVIVLAGWMRILSMAFLARFPGRVINIHPALPGEFPGTHAIERALQSHQRLGLRRTGVMVHYVPDEDVDAGPVIASTEVVIEPGDSVQTLTARVHDAEHQILVKALQILEPEAAPGVSDDEPSPARRAWS